jgi:putative tryptophan/tyrosine transport system substrate-binding protein
MRRREFIAGLGSAAAWPIVARAQRQQRVRRVALLTGWSESDAARSSEVRDFIERLAQLGWVQDKNVQIDQRWGNADVNRMRSLAKELV